MTTDMPAIELSQQARSQMRRIGIKATVEVRVCKKCRLASELVPPDKRHPMEEKVRRARQARDAYDPRKDSRSALHEKSKHLHRMVSLMHHSSRCCGVRYVKVELDNHLPLYERWLDRHRLVRFTVEELRKTARLVVNPVTEMGYEAPITTEDDDVMMMTAMIGTGELFVRQLVKIFREEDARRASAGASDRAVSA